MISNELINSGLPVRRDVTIKHIAAEVGLSQPAVTQVLNGTGRISEATRQRVMAVAERLGYRPNAAARAIATRKTLQVGILVLNSPSDPVTFPHTYYTILGANMALENAGYVLCLVRIGDVEQSLEGHSRVFREHVLDGVIVTTSIPDRLSQQVKSLVPACVWTDCNVWGPTRCIRRNEFAVGKAVAEAAAKAGYRKVIFVTERAHVIDAPDHYSHIDRSRGIEEVCGTKGMSLEILMQTWAWSEEFGNSLRSKIGPDVAVITTDSTRARLVQQMAVAHRLIPGTDFGLASCDSVPEVNTTWPGLSRVEFDRVELGRRSAEMMLAILDGGKALPKSVQLESAWHQGTTLSRA